MKKLFLILLTLVMVSPVFADRSTLFQDIGIRLGHASFSDEKGQLDVMAGFTIGLSERFELNPEVIVPVTPVPFSKCNLGFELGMSVLGNRINKTDISGASLNTVVSAGFFTENFRPKYITLRVTPVTLGTPFSGKRDSLLPIGIAWDLEEEKLSCFFSIAMYDHYIKGSWAQLRNRGE